MRAIAVACLLCMTLGVLEASAGSWFKQTPKQKAFLARMARDAVKYGVEDYRKGKYKSARKHFSRATSYNPKYLRAWTNLGYVEIQLGEYKKAERAFDKAVDLSSKDVRANSGLGRALYGQGKYKRALRYLNRAVRYKRDHADSRYHRSNVYYHLGRYQEALKDAERAVRLAPKSKAARAWLEKVRAKVKATQ